MKPRHYSQGTGRTPKSPTALRGNDGSGGPGSRGRRRANVLSAPAGRGGIWSKLGAAPWSSYGDFRGETGVAQNEYWPGDGGFWPLKPWFWPRGQGLRPCGGVWLAHRGAEAGLARGRLAAVRSPRRLSLAEGAAHFDANSGSFFGPARRRTPSPSRRNKRARPPRGRPGCYRFSLLVGRQGRHKAGRSWGLRSRWWRPVGHPPVVNRFHHPTGVYDNRSTDHLLTYGVSAAGAALPEDGSAALLVRRAA